MGGHHQRLNPRMSMQATPSNDLQVFDEEAGEYRRRHGYKRAGDEAEVPIIEASASDAVRTHGQALGIRGCGAIVACSRLFVNAAACPKACSCSVQSLCWP